MLDLPRRVAASRAAAARASPARTQASAEAEQRARRRRRDQGEHDPAPIRAWTALDALRHADRADGAALLVTGTAV